MTNPPIQATTAGDVDQGHQPDGPRDDAMQALITTLSRVEGSAPTWAVGWSAHHVAAHVTGAAEERADHVGEHLAGAPPRPTRSWEEREPPLRALAYPRLQERLVAEAVRFERAVDRLGEDDVVEYTGWSMTAARLRMHSHSEAALHRWDLVGDDDTSARLLADPAMTSHALAAFAAIPLDEAARWVDAVAVPVVLRAPGHPDLTALPGRGLTTELPAVDPVMVDLEPHEMPLVVWGRTPARLRDPQRAGESVSDVLHRLTGRP